MTKKRVTTILLWVFISLIILFCLICMARVTLYDTFNIPSNSITPTLMTGDKVLVNKRIFGARLYSDLDSLTSKNPKTHRQSASRKLRHNDIVVFNTPHPYSNEYETMRPLTFSADTLHYTFTKNWYFMAGDDVNNSIDSRYIGAVPEEHIVGVVSKVIFSKTENGWRKNRFLKNMLNTK